MEQYNRVVDNLINNKLKNVFIRYFGEEHKEKIERVFSKVNLVMLAPNLSMEEIDDNIRKIKEFIDEELDRFGIKESKLNEQGKRDGLFINNSSLRGYQLVILNQAYFQYYYYLEMKKNKLNDADTTIKIFDNEKLRDINYEVIINEFKNLPDEVLGVAPSNIANDIYYIGIVSINLNISVIVHELIHHLVKEQLAIIVRDNEETILTSLGHVGKGIFDEILIEYITKDIMTYIVSLGMNYLYDYENIDSEYLHLDKACGNIVERIFTLAKDIIKNNIIKGNSSKINKILGLNELEILDMYMKSLVEISETITEEQYEIALELFNHINSKIENNYNDYLEAIKLEDEYVTKLEEEGRIRRIK